MMTIMLLFLQNNLPNFWWIIKKKYTVKCQVCDKEIGDIPNSDLATQHINENPGHLDYRVIMEMILPALSDNQPTLNTDKVQ